MTACRPTAPPTTPALDVGWDDPLVVSDHRFGATPTEPAPAQVVPPDDPAAGTMGQGMGAASVADWARPRRRRLVAPEERWRTRARGGRSHICGQPATGRPTLAPPPAAAERIRFGSDRRVAAIASVVTVIAVVCLMIAIRSSDGAGASRQVDAAGIGVSSTMPPSAFPAAPSTSTTTPPLGDEFGPGCGKSPED